jgi:phosphate transport system permease protein
LAVSFIIIFLFSTAIPTINEIGFFSFIFGDVWLPTADEPLFGIRNLVLTSFFGTVGAIVIGVPLGILAAVAIAEVLPEKTSKIVYPAVNLLAGIPSVIYGAIGAILLVPFVQKVFSLNTGATLFSAILVLSIMVLPTIISVSVTSIRAVPKTYMEASLALGLTKEASLYKIIIPSAKSGIMTSVLLGIGRAIGEAMAIILVAGNVPGFPELFRPARFLTTGIVAEMGYADGLHRDVLFTIGAVLFIFILVINSLFYTFIKRMGKNNG